MRISEHLRRDELGIARTRYVSRRDRRSLPPQGGEEALVGEDHRECFLHPIGQRRRSVWTTGQQDVGLDARDNDVALIAHRSVGGSYGDSQVYVPVSLAGGD